MSYLIPFNSSIVQPNGFNNIYRRNFVGNAVNFRNAEVAVHSINMYNSVFNVDQGAYNNSTLQILMPTASTTSTINITLPDGLYGYADMTKLIQSLLVAQGAYLIDTDGNHRHYIQVSENPVYYAAQVDLLPVPTSLPSGWSRPTTGLYSTTGSGLPTTSRVPIMNINNAAFGSLIGFNVAQYPSTPQTTQQSFLSNKPPQVHPVSSYQVRCSLIDNKYTSPPDILATFDTQGTQSGQLISYRPNEHVFLPIPDGSYNNITLTITDQESNFVRIRDPNIQITLIIRERQ